MLIPLILGSLKLKDIDPKPDMLIATAWFNPAAIPAKISISGASDAGEVLLWKEGKYYYSSDGYFISRMSKTSNVIKYGLNGVIFSGEDEILRPDTLTHSPKIRQCLIDSIFFGIPAIGTNMKLILKGWPTDGHSFGKFRIDKVDWPVEVWVKNGANFLGVRRITIINRKNDHVLFKIQVCDVSRLKTMLDNLRGVKHSYFRSDLILRKLPQGKN